MKRILFKFRRYADGVLLIFAKTVRQNLSGNLFYPTTDPTLAALSTIIGNYEVSLTVAKEGGKGNIAAKNARKQELVDALVALAFDLMKTNATLEALSTTAFPLSKEPQPLPPLGVPVITRVENGESVGELVVVVEAMPGVKTYMYEYTPEPLTPDSVWTNQNSTSVKGIISGLVSGKKYWCRVAAFGSGDQVEVSDPALSRIVQ
jgi:hypothetical protein